MMPLMLLTIILNLLRMLLCQIFSSRREEGGEEKTHGLKILTRTDKPWTEIGTSAGAFPDAERAGKNFGPLLRSKGGTKLPLFSVTFLFMFFFPFTNNFIEGVMLGLWNLECKHDWPLEGDLWLKLSHQTPNSYRTMLQFRVKWAFF